MIRYCALVMLAFFLMAWAEPAEMDAEMDMGPRQEEPTLENAIEAIDLGRFRLAAMQLPLVAGAGLQDRAPASRAGIALAGTVGVDDHMRKFSSHGGALQDRLARGHHKAYMGCDQSHRHSRHPVYRDVDSCSPASGKF